MFQYTMVTCINQHQKYSEAVVWRCSVESSKVFRKKKICKIHRKTPVQSLFFNKVSSLRRATLSEKRLWHKCFPEIFAICFVLQNHFFCRTPLVVASQLFSRMYLLKSLESKTTIFQFANVFPDDFKFNKTKSENSPYFGRKN